MPGSSLGRTPSSRDRRQDSSRPAALHHTSLFPLLAPLDTPVRLADAAFKPSAAPTTPAQRPIIPAVCHPPPPRPSLTPLHKPYTSISASISQALLHQTAVIQPTNGSHANALRCILTGNPKYQSTGSVCVCVGVRACVRAYVRQGEKLWRPIKHFDCSFSTSVQLTGERFSENHVQHVPSHLNSTVVMPTMTFMLAGMGIWLLSC